MDGLWWLVGIKMSDIKHPSVYKDDNCELFLEVFHSKVLVHCYIYKWRKGLIEKFDVIFLQLLEQLKLKNIPCLYAAILPEDYKLKKFAAMFGFDETEETILDNEKNVRELYKCLT